MKHMKDYLLIILVLFLIYIFCDNIEGFTDKELYENLMDDFSKIFPSGNRNAGGPQFYHHIVTSMNPSIEEFQKYNTFYCAVSGSPIDPGRDKIYDNVIVDGLDGKTYYGKYYRCCWPCSCDIMRDDTVLVEDYTITLRDGDYTHKVLTINDPCLNSDRIPDEITSFQCENDMTQNGIHTDSGRLIIGILHDVEEYTNQDTDNDLSNMCETRNSTPIDELRGGMGDISLKLYSL